MERECNSLMKCFAYQQSGHLSPNGAQHNLRQARMTDVDQGSPTIETKADDRTLDTSVYGTPPSLTAASPTAPVQIARVETGWIQDTGAEASLIPHVTLWSISNQYLDYSEVMEEQLRLLECLV